MVRLTAQDLLPETQYAVQARVTLDGTVFSEWGPAFEFETRGDTDNPLTPENFIWISVGDAFFGQWDPVTTNIEDDEITITRYELEIKPGDEPELRKVIAVPPVIDEDQTVKYTLSFDENKALFNNIPRPVLVARVRAVDNKGLVSDWTEEETAQNPPPGPPTDVNAVTGANSIGIRWTPPTDDDLIGYNIYVGASADFVPSEGNKVWFGNATSFVYNTATPGTLYFKVFSLDKFNQESEEPGVTSGTAGDPFEVDTEAPDTPEFVDEDCTITPNENGIGAVAYLKWVMAEPVPTDVAGFYIKYRKAGDAWFTLSFNKDERECLISLDEAYTSYTFQIMAYDWSGNESPFSDNLVLSGGAATPPATPSGIVSTPIPGGIRYTWSPVSDTTLQRYEVQLATNSGFTTGVLDYNVSTGTTPTLTAYALAPTTTYYMRVRAVNPAGPGSWSTTDTETTQSYNGLITAVSADIITPGVLDSGVIDIGAGAALRVNDGAILSNTYNGGTPAYNPSATTGFYIDETHFHVPEGQISAKALSTGTMNAAIISLTGSARIETLGYDGTSGFRLSASGLEIPDGTISATKVNIGSGRNMLHADYADFEAYADWFGTVQSTSGVSEQIVNFTTNGYNNISWNSFAEPKLIISTINSAYNNKQFLRLQRSSTSSTADLYLAPSSTSYINRCSSNTDYTFSIYAKGSTTVTVAIGFKWGDGSITTSNVTVTAGSWNRYGVTKTCPPGVTSFFPIVRIVSPTTIGTYVDIDAAMVEETDALSYVTPPVSGVRYRAWQPPGQTVIDGYSIRTGALRSNLTTTVNGQTIPRWIIDTEGDAQFANAKIRGVTVVGAEVGDTSDLASSWIQSASFVEGSTSGWKISSDGVVLANKFISRNSTNGARVEIKNDTNVEGNYSNGMFMYPENSGWEPGQVYTRYYPAPLANGRFRMGSGSTSSGDLANSGALQISSPQTTTTKAAGKQPAFIQLISDDNNTANYVTQVNIRSTRFIATANNFFFGDIGGDSIVMKINNQAEDATQTWSFRSNNNRRINLDFENANSNLITSLNASGNRQDISIQGRWVNLGISTASGYLSARENSGSGAGTRPWLGLAMGVGSAGPTGWTYLASVVRATPSNSNAGITVMGSDFQNTSDMRVKREVVKAPDVLSDLKTLNVYEYDNDAHVGNSRERGVSAQEIQERWPDGVSVGEDDGLLAVKHYFLISTAIKAIQELSAEVDELKELLSQRS